TAARRAASGQSGPGPGFGPIQHPARRAARKVPVPRSRYGVLAGQPPASRKMPRRVEPPRPPTFRGVSWPSLLECLLPKSPPRTEFFDGAEGGELLAKGIAQGKSKGSPPIHG